MIRKASLLITTALLAALPAFPVDFPQPTGYANDFANRLDASDLARLEQRLRGYEQRTSAEISIAIVPSLEGMPVESYATGLFKDWDIGKRGANNGVLFLWAPNERKVRIAVG